MAKVTFQTVDSFPSRGVDSDVIAIGQEALADKKVRSGPDNADTRQFLSALRTWLSQQNPPRKLKTRTVSDRIFWQILNEPPKKRQNGASPVTTVQAATQTVAAQGGTGPRNNQR